MILVIYFWVSDDDVDSQRVKLENKTKIQKSQPAITSHLPFLAPSSFVVILSSISFALFL